MVSELEILRELFKLAQKMADATRAYELNRNYLTEREIHYSRHAFNACKKQYEELLNPEVLQLFY